MPDLHLNLTGFNEPDGPYDTVHGVTSWASAGGHLGHLCEQWTTVLVFRIEADAQRTLVMRYDRDGFDL